MKYLHINDNKGFFKINEIEELKSIDSISKDDIFKLINLLMEKEDFEIKKKKKELKQKKAHNIIYRNLYQRFLELKQEKNNIIDSTNQYFAEAFQKYSN